MDSHVSKVNLVRPSVSRFEIGVLSLFCLAVPGLSFAMWTQRYLPASAAVHGEGIDRMMSYLLVTVGAMMVIGHAVLAFLIWKFSSRDKVSFRLTSFQTECKIGLIPCVIMALVAEGGVMAIGMPVWNKFFGSPPPKDAWVVEAVAEQFAWTFRYPGKDQVFGRTDYKLMADDNLIGLDLEDQAAKDDMVETGFMHVPVDRPVRVRLRSKDVIHAFFLPTHRMQQDVVPGMTVEIWFTPNKIGDFEILCSQLCGMGHFRMKAMMNVLSKEAFEEWQKQNSPK